MKVSILYGGVTSWLEEDSWSGPNQVRDRAQKSIKEFGRSQVEELTSECWEFGSDFEESEC